MSQSGCRSHRRFAYIYSVLLAVTVRSLEPEILMHSCTFSFRVRHRGSPRLTQQRHGADNVEAGSGVAEKAQRIGECVFGLEAELKRLKADLEQSRKA